MIISSEINEEILMFMVLSSYKSLDFSADVVGKLCDAHRRMFFHTPVPFPPFFFWLGRSSIITMRTAAIMITVVISVYMTFPFLIFSFVCWNYRIFLFPMNFPFYIINDNKK